VSYAVACAICEEKSRPDRTKEYMAAWNAAREAIKNG
jgi:hypothetical protein